jgi:helix-turn-helix protein
MSDLLHQIKKGAWSHLLNWFQSLLQEIFEVRKANDYLDEMDNRFALVPCFKGIKSFPKGIRDMEQITAGEYADIMKVYRTVLFN